MRHQRILLVDDDRDLVELLAARCREMGFTVDTACNPLTAVTSMTSYPPDLFCLDVNMPTGNGLDVCQFLLRGTRVPSKPVIILTGRCDHDTICRCVELQAHYVRKTTDIWQHLRPTIEKLLPVSPVHDSQ
jgi:DNA-binding response OmpR family regulator